ncbi:MAG: hypothetical protein NTU83_03170 [Candidatus Hydrogenedentes bacterium]|nr:hypothetical protein [Candidatus Hydrogenedentota bacterium]
MRTRFDELAAMARENDPAFRSVAREECVAAARAYALERRTAIRELHNAGESGLDVVRALTGTADALLRGVFDFGLYTVANRGALLSRVALCALGGYGRAELSPYSDLDVCLLYDGVLDSNIRDLNAYLVPFVWDMGFVLNYSIRSVSEAIELATADLKVYTCILESRLITGDSTTFARLKLNLREAFRDDDRVSAAFIHAKTGARYADLEPEHRDLYKTEPNIKENRGGLRDFHTALWILMMTYGPLTLDDVAALGIVSPQEHLDVVQGLDFIWRIRNELHFAANREADLLTFDNKKHTPRRGRRHLPAHAGLLHGRAEVAPLSAYCRAHLQPTYRHGHRRRDGAIATRTDRAARRATRSGRRRPVLVRRTTLATHGGVLGMRTTDGAAQSRDRTSNPCESPPGDGYVPNERSRAPLFRRHLQPAHAGRLRPAPSRESWPAWAILAGIRRDSRADLL